MARSAHSPHPATETEKDRVRFPTCEGMEAKGCWLHYHPSAGKTVTSEEQTSLRALVAYVSHNTGRTVFRVERELSDHFCVPNMKFLPHDLYDRALCYLADQIPPSSR